MSSNIRKFLTALALSAIAVSALAQTQVATTEAAPAAAAAPLPAKLCGSWTTPDHRWAQTWCAEEINAQTGTTTVTWYSSRLSCHIIGMPMVLKVDEGMTHIKITGEDKNWKYMHCQDKFTAELRKNGEKWVGTLFVNTVGGAQYSVAETTLEAK